MMNKFRPKTWFPNIINIVIGCIWFIPLYYLLVTTFKTSQEASANPLALPKVFTLSNYIKAYKSMHFLRAFRNNLVILVVSLIILVLLSSMAAYVIARSDARIFKVMSNIIIAGLIIPFQIAIIPLYKIVNDLHLMNKHIGVIVINVFCINMVFSIFLFKGFINTVPVELEEAASIDGCGIFKTFLVIVFPLLKPIIMTVAILNSLAIWNDFMTPLLFLQDPKKAVLLQEVYKNVGPFSTDWASFFPMLVMATLPLILLYLLLQKHIINGVVAGAVKG